MIIRTIAMNIFVETFLECYKLRLALGKLFNRDTWTGSITLESIQNVKERQNSKPYKKDEEEIMKRS